MMKFLIFLFSIFYFLFSFVSAAGEVVINEIAWMGTPQSSQNEWIELANTTGSEQDMSGWKLETQDGGMKITLSGKIPAGGFFLLERTDDTSVPGVNADQIYTGALSNSGEVLILKDKNGNEIDRVDASQGWPAGDNTTKDTMQRVGSSWITAKPTPRQANIFTSATAVQKEEIIKNEQTQGEQTVSIIQSEASPPIIQETTVKQEPTRTVLVEYPKTIYISEFLPDPEGSDEKGEWIELYNDAKDPADISGFFLDDGEEGSKPYQIPEGITIVGKGFLVFSRTDTKIALNNKSDEVRLLYPNRSVAAKVSYQDASEGNAGAYDQLKKEFFWTKNLTPQGPNIFSTLSQIKDAQLSNYQASQLDTLEALPTLDLSTLGGEGENVIKPDSIRTLGSLEYFWIILGAFIIGAGVLFGYLRFVKKLFGFFI